MNKIFDLTTRPDTGHSVGKNDPNDLRLGEIISTRSEDYPASEIIILGLQTVEKSKDNKNDVFASETIRQEFYNLTNFGISRNILDLGNYIFNENSESDTDQYQQIVETVLKDGKRLIVIGGGNEFSYQAGAEMGKVFGEDRWLAINVDSHLDNDFKIHKNNLSAFRRLLEENILIPKYYYQIGFQPYFCSPVNYKFLQNKNVQMVSLEQLRSRETADLELRELIRQEFIHHSRSMSIFFNFSMNAVRSSDAPGVTISSPFGLRAGEFLTLVQYSAKLVNTKIIQFTEVKPELDIENRTSKLVAIAMHRFCSTIAES